MEPQLMLTKTQVRDNSGPGNVYSQKAATLLTLQFLFLLLLFWWDRSAGSLLGLESKQASITLF